MNFLKFIYPDLGNLEAERDPYESQPKVENNMGQSLSRLIGFDVNNGTFRFLICDRFGRLLTTGVDADVTEATQKAVSVDTTDDVLLNQNSARKAYIVQNLGAADIFLAFGSNLAIASRFKVPVDGVFSDTLFVGELHAITSLGSADVRVVEYA